MTLEQNLSWVSTTHRDLFTALLDKRDINAVLNMALGKRDAGLTKDLLYISVLIRPIKYCEVLRMDVGHEEFRSQVSFQLGRFRQLIGDYLNKKPRE